MEELLLKAIEYYEHALHGDNYDTWHCARFIERWAEPEIIKKFKNIYAEYSKDDILEAIFTTLKLFRKIAVDTAAYCDINIHMKVMIIRQNGLCGTNELSKADGFEKALNFICEVNLWNMEVN